MSVNTGWSVGKVAGRCGVNVSTLHFYEEKGLISSWRNEGNQRRYQKDVLRRVSVIKAAQKLGIKLEDIKIALASLPELQSYFRSPYPIAAGSPPGGDDGPDDDLDTEAPKSIADVRRAVRN